MIIQLAGLFSYKSEPSIKYRPDFRSIEIALGGFWKKFKVATNFFLLFIFKNKCNARILMVSV